MRLVFCGAAVGLIMPSSWSPGLFAVLLCAAMVALSARDAHRGGERLREGDGVDADQGDGRDAESYYEARADHVRMVGRRRGRSMCSQGRWTHG
jgi:hypothetical protein